MKTVKLQKGATTAGYPMWKLGVPTEIGRAIEAAGYETFTIELTEDGLLYGPVTAQQQETDMPSWLRQAG